MIGPRYAPRTAPKCLLTSQAENTLAIIVTKRLGLVMSDSIRGNVLQLLDQRKHIETKLQHQRDILEANNVTMSTNVLDAQGFPRSDLDIPTIRTARNQIRSLLHDRELVNANLEALLPSALSQGVSMSANTSPISNSETQTPQNQQLAIRSVQRNSPAARSGLEAGDLLVSWDELRPINATHMPQLPLRVKEGVPIALEVKRMHLDGRNIHVQLTLIPSSHWDGRSLLGCHIVPVET